MSNEIAAFWAWFNDHREVISRLESPEDPLWDEALGVLKKVDEGLWFEMSEPDGGVRDLVITAEGNEELFPLAEAVVRAAPKIAGWTFTALKPAMGFEFTTEYEGIELDPASMWFIPLESEEDPDSVGVEIAIPGYDAESHRIYANAVLVILETGLGERAVAELAVVDVAEPPEDPEAAGYIELPELADFLEWRKKKRK